jgi:hypothetical protein
VVEGTIGEVLVDFSGRLGGHADEKVVSDTVGVNLLEVVADDVAVCGFDGAVGALFRTVEGFESTEGADFHPMEFSYKRLAI